MSEVEIPVALRKYKKFLVKNIHLDENCSNNHVFFDILNKMNNSEDIYLFMKKKYKNVDSQLDSLRAAFSSMFEVYAKKMEELENLITYNQRSRSQQRKNESKIVTCNAEFYSDLGRTLYDFGILESLVNRSNTNFSRIDANYLRINLEQALNEFDSRKNSRTTNPVISMKLAFYINKITKYMDDIEYGDMLESDRMKCKAQGDSRQKFLSKLKTDYLKKIYEANKNLTDEDSSVVFGSQEEYEKLFGKEFDNLDFNADLKKVKRHELRKDIIYVHKAGFLNQAFLILMSSDSKKQMDRDIKSWGICEDENDGYVFGMNLYSYPMPLTVHIQKANLTRALKVCKSEMGLLTTQINVPKYKTLFTPDKKVFTTNVLFETTEVQRSRIKNGYENNPDNECLRFFYEQISGRGFDRREVDSYGINELL